MGRVNITEHWPPRWPPPVVEESANYTLYMTVSFFRHTVQANLIITLSFGSIETDCVIREPHYNEVTYYRHKS